jgi:hypothetical protein
MKRTNRVEPIVTDRDVNDVTQATVTTTTQMEFVRRIQVIPMVSKLRIFDLKFYLIVACRLRFSFSY